jgi:hypothetical protein
MTSVLKRRGFVPIALALSVAAALAVGLALPTFSAAETGDFDNPVHLSALPWSQDQTGSLVATTWAGIDWFAFDYMIPVAKGQTVSFTSTVPPDDGESYMSLYATVDTPLGIDSQRVSDGVEILTFMAPKTEEYCLTIYGSQVETFSLGGAIVPTQRYKMTTLSVPGGRKGKSFTASVKVWPVYNSLYPPIKYRVQRKVGKKWKAYSIAQGTLPNTDNTYNFVHSYTRFLAKMKIKRAGTYRIRAEFSDAAHPKVTSTGWKTIKIK